ncbi:endolytic transglycosylase MltG [Agromyces sp. NPDC058110]|uniref:endolytic transglycosylase MltG n=1 Tax=Agromyces sp. NPDC058110 TaxID=3346345 RepID=UPI0036D8C14D
MTQLPPERRDPDSERAASDWHALLNGEAPKPPTRPARPAAPAGPGGSPADAAQAGGVPNGAAPTGGVPTAAAGAAASNEPGRPLTRRELREREQAAAASGSADAVSAADGFGTPGVPLTPIAAEGAAPDERRVVDPITASLAVRASTGPQPAPQNGQPLPGGSPSAPAERMTGPQPTQPTDPFVASRVDRRADAFDEYHEPKKKRRGPWGCLIGLLIVGALIAGAVFFLQGPIAALVAQFTPAEDYDGAGTGEVVFMIHDGDTGSSIAENLADQDIVASYDAFYDLLLEQSPEPEFHPGAYQMANQMSAQAALDALTDPANKLENTFVIPEGTATVDALPTIAEGTGVPLEELQAAAAESPQSYGLPAEATNLEGFLFPATYTLDPGLDAHAVLQTLVDRQFQALDEAGVAPADRWKTIVLAALVQREAGLRDDFYKVSRVFQNRLDPNQWPSGLLQSDATVAYGTGNTHLVTTTDEERADAGNPYNTYVHPGLPVGPISNPGDLAIDAALHPADGPWLFFVTWNLDTGETIFSATVEEHEAAVAKWLAWMDEHPEYG